MLDNFKNMAEGLKSTLDGMNKETNSFTEKITEKFSASKDIFKDFSIINKIKEFSSNAVHMVAELDEHLVDTNSSYEVGDFRVTANIGVVAGMSLDIRFIKTQTAKSVSQKKNQLLSITNPKTGKEFKVARLSLAGKNQAKVRDPESGDILLIDSKTGKVISSENNDSIKSDKNQLADHLNNLKPNSKESLKDKDEFLNITNPVTKNTIKISRNKLKGLDQARIKDPSNGDILIFETKTGKVVTHKKASG